MNNKIKTEAITFDDVLLLPRYSDFKRIEVDLTVALHEKLVLKLPIISSPMDTVTEYAMAAAMSQNGALGIVHRNLQIAQQAEIITKIKATPVKNLEIATLDADKKLIAAAAVGAGSDLEERLNTLNAAKVDVVCVDSGHGHTKYIMDAIKYIKANFPHLVIIAGNVATYDGAKALIEAGADVLRVGIGPGSICTTRIISGMGVPQLTAIYESARAAENTNVKVIADGGIKQLGDIAKAMGMGAHAVMLGSLFAGHDQAPGEILEVNNEKYKSYRGMGSLGAMVKGGAERYGQNPNEIKAKLIPEGVEGLVKYKGDVNDYLFQINGSLRSAFYYTGSRNLAEFHKNTEFVKISPAGMRESDTHSIKVTETGSNYNRN